MIHIWEEIWKGTKTTDADNLFIPDTITFYNGNLYWYFRSKKKPQILRKNITNTNLDNICKKFHIPNYKKYLNNQNNQNNLNDNFDNDNDNFSNFLNDEFNLDELSINYKDKFSIKCIVYEIHFKKETQGLGLINESKAQNFEITVDYLNSEQTVEYLQNMFQTKNQLLNTNKYNQNRYFKCDFIQQNKKKIILQLPLFPQDKVDSHIYQVDWTENLCFVKLFQNIVSQFKNQEKNINDIFPGQVKSKNFGILQGFKYFNTVTKTHNNQERILDSQKREFFKQITFEDIDSFCKGTEINSDTSIKRLKEITQKIVEILNYNKEFKNKVKKFSAFFRKYDNQFYLISINSVQFEQETPNDDFNQGIFTSFFNYNIDRNLKKYDQIFNQLQQKIEQKINKIKLICEKQTEKQEKLQQQNNPDKFIKHRVNSLDLKFQLNNKIKRKFGLTEQNFLSVLDKKSVQKSGQKGPPQNQQNCEICLKNFSETEQKYLFRKEVENQKQLNFQKNAQFKQQMRQFLDDIQLLTLCHNCYAAKIKQSKIQFQNLNNLTLLSQKPVHEKIQQKTQFSNNFFDLNISDNKILTFDNVHKTSSRSSRIQSAHQYQNQDSQNKPICFPQTLRKQYNSKPTYYQNQTQIQSKRNFDLNENQITFEQNFKTTNNNLTYTNINTNTYITQQEEIDNFHMDSTVFHFSNNEDDDLHKEKKAINKKIQKESLKKPQNQVFDDVITQQVTDFEINEDKNNAQNYINIQESLQMEELSPLKKKKNQQKKLSKISQKQKQQKQQIQQLENQEIQENFQDQEIQEINQDQTQDKTEQNQNNLSQADNSNLVNQSKIQNQSYQIQQLINQNLLNNSDSQFLNQTVEKERKFNLSQIKQNKFQQQNQLEIVLSTENEMYTQQTERNENYNLINVLRQKENITKKIENNNNNNENFGQKEYQSQQQQGENQDFQNNYQMIADNQKTHQKTTVIHKNSQFQSTENSNNNSAQNYFKQNSHFQQQNTNFSSENPVNFSEFDNFNQLVQNSDQKLQNLNLNQSEKQSENEKIDQNKNDTEYREQENLKTNEYIEQQILLKKQQEKNQLKENEINNKISVKNMQKQENNSNLAVILDEKDLTQYEQNLSSFFIDSERIKRRQSPQIQNSQISSNLTKKSFLKSQSRKLKSSDRNNLQDYITLQSQFESHQYRRSMGLNSDDYYQEIQEDEEDIINLFNNQNKNPEKQNNKNNNSQISQQFNKLVIRPYSVREKNTKKKLINSKKFQNLNQTQIHHEQEQKVKQKQRKLSTNYLINRNQSNSQSQNKSNFQQKYKNQIEEKKLQISYIKLQQQQQLQEKNMDQQLKQLYERQNKSPKHQKLYCSITKLNPYEIENQNNNQNYQLNIQNQTQQQQNNQKIKNQSSQEKIKFQNQELQLKQQQYLQKLQQPIKKNLKQISTIPKPRRNKTHSKDQKSNQLKKIRSQSHQPEYPQIQKRDFQQKQNKYSESQNQNQLQKQNYNQNQQIIPKNQKQNQKNNQRNQLSPNQINQQQQNNNIILNLNHNDINIHQQQLNENQNKNQIQNQNGSNNLKKNKNKTVYTRLQKEIIAWQKQIDKEEKLVNQWQSSIINDPQGSVYQQEQSQEINELIVENL